jgi:hypothetical protein
MSTITLHRPGPETPPFPAPAGSGQSIPARVTQAEAALRARYTALYQALNGGGDGGSGSAGAGAGPASAEHVDGLRALARLLLVAKAPLYDVDVALDVLVNKRWVPCAGGGCAERSCNSGRGGGGGGGQRQQAAPRGC